MPKDASKASRVELLLQLPFVVGGHIYASDGRICVRQPHRGEPFAAPGTHPPVEELNWAREPRNAWTAAELPPLPAPQRCFICAGVGMYTCSCPHCDCGRHPCDRCDGRGYLLEALIHIPPRPTTLSHYYADILARHGARIECHENPRKPVYFTIPGTEIEGLLATIANEEGA